jgi:predicted DNA-binding transcriptional regulator AlpA
MENRLLTVETLAPMLCLSPRTLRNKLCSDPGCTLPPRVKVPGTRGPRWRLSDVLAWLAALPIDSEPDLSVPARRPGRRRKAV